MCTAYVHNSHGTHTYKVWKINTKQLEPLIFWSFVNFPTYKNLKIYFYVRVCVYKSVPAYLYVYYMCAMAVGQRGCQISLELWLQVGAEPVSYKPSLHHFFIFSLDSILISLIF